jgi:hypothetical protein
MCRDQREVEDVRANRENTIDGNAQGPGGVVDLLSKAAIFGDERTPRTKLTELNRASLRFKYELLRGDELLATGYTCHGCVEFETGRPLRLPKKLYALRNG